jgi:DNA-binding MarR family transcriptional regulator
MKKESIDLGIKLAQAFTKIGQGHLSPDLLIFVIIDTVRPHELSVEDLQEITKLDRGTVAPIVGNLVKIGYVQEKGGLVSRA